MVNTDRLCMSCMNDNGGEKICSICGHDSSKDNPAHLLKSGSWVNANRYLVGKAIEESGDGVTYIGWDNDKNAVVNIREYFPKGLAVRSPDRMTVTPAENQGLGFNRGKNDFISLHSSLSSLVYTTAILKTVDVFEENGTVYSVISTISGITLKAFLLRNGGSLKWEQLRPLFMPLVSSIMELHQNGIIHRGISADTILVGRDGKLYLTGFSINDARTVGDDFPASLQTGYAAPEQYGNFGGLADEKSDIYALGAVIFRCLFGSVLPDAGERMNNDALSIPAKITETVPKNVLGAIANSLKVNPAERIASIERLKQLLEIIPQETSQQSEPVKSKSSAGKMILISALITALVFAALFALFYFTVGKDFFDKKDESSSSQPTSSYETPSFAEPGQLDPNMDPEPDEKTYDVPDYKEMTYAEIMKDADLSDKFEVFIIGKEYSDDIPRGKVTNQTVKAGEKVVKDTEIGLYVSLGPSTVSMPKILGLTQEQAYIVLLETGFLPENIEFTDEIYDDTAKPSVALRATYNEGDKVSLDSAIKIYINGYVGEETSSKAD